MTRLTLTVAVMLFVVSASFAQSVSAIRIDAREGKAPDFTVYHMADINQPGHEPDVWAYNVQDSARLNLWLGTRWNTGTPGLRVSGYVSWTSETTALQLLTGLQYTNCDSNQRTSGWVDARLPLNDSARAQLTLMDIRKEWRIGSSPVYLGLAGRATLGENGQHESRWGLGLEIPGKNICMTARWLPVNGADEARVDVKLLGF